MNLILINLAAHCLRCAPSDIGRGQPWPHPMEGIFPDEFPFQTAAGFHTKQLIYPSFHKILTFSSRGMHDHLAL